MRTYFSYSAAPGYASRVFLFDELSHGNEMPDFALACDMPVFNVVIGSGCVAVVPFEIHKIHLFWVANVHK